MFAVMLPRSEFPTSMQKTWKFPHVWSSEAVAERMAVRAFAAFLEQYRVLGRVSQKGNPYSVARLAGHNVARFDAPRLLRMFKRNGGAFLPADAFMPLDTMQLALWRFAEVEKRPKNLKLRTLCEFFGIETAGAHDALADVRMTVQVARHLFEQAASEPTGVVIEEGAVSERATA